MNKLWYIQMTGYVKKKVSYQAMEKHGGNSSIPLLHGWSQLERITWCVSLTTDGPQVVMPLLMLFFFFPFTTVQKGYAFNKSFALIFSQTSASKHNIL